MDMLMTKLTLGFMGAVAMIPVIGQLPADTALEKLGKGTTQVVLAVVVIALALAIVQIFRLHRKDAIDSKKELREEMEKSACMMYEQMDKSQKIISDNTAAMNLMATSNEQLKDAIIHLSQIIERKVG